MSVFSDTKGWTFSQYAADDPRIVAEALKALADASLVKIDALALQAAMNAGAAGTADALSNLQLRADEINRRLRYLAIRLRSGELSAQMVGCGRGAETV